MLKFMERSDFMDNMYMQVAYQTSKASRAQRTKVGAVLVKDGVIVSTGYNGTPRSTDNNCEYEENSQLKTLDCVIHAELNCILNMVISGNGAPLINSTIYVMLSPCIKCAAIIKQVNIKRVCYEQEYRDIEGIEYLKKYGVIVDKIKIDAYE